MATVDEMTGSAQQLAAAGAAWTSVHGLFAEMSPEQQDAVDAATQACQAATEALAAGPVTPTEENVLEQGVPVDTPPTEEPPTAEPGQ